MGEKLKQIGEVAKEIGCTTRTVRYYEELGLIAPACRSRGQFRLYDLETVQKVALIQKLNSLRFPLSAIKEMFSIRKGSKTGKEASMQVVKILHRQRERLQKMINQYQDMAKDVESAIELVTTCFDCEVKPSKEKCQGCKVITSREPIPLSVKVILWPLVEDIKGDWRRADLDEKTRAMLALSEKITDNAPQIREKDLESLREVSLSDKEILDVVLIASFFNYMDRLADTLGVELDRQS